MLGFYDVCISAKERHSGFRSERYVAKIHDSDTGFGFRFNREGVEAGFIDIEVADFSRDEVLKSAGVLNDDVDELIADGKFNFAPAAAFAATLQDFDFVYARCIDDKIPSDEILQLRPVADGVFVRLW